MRGALNLIRARQIVIFGSAAITIAVSPWLNFDSTNLPKALVLSGLAFAIVALYLSSPGKPLWRVDKPLLLTSALFLVFLTLPLFFTSAPLNQQFWGMFGRSNGWLSYFSCLVFFLVASLMREKKDFEKLLRVFIGTAAILTIYALVQYTGNDPIPWSQKMVIATLGNINFLSAFFGLTSLAALSIGISKKASGSTKVFLFTLIIVDLFLVFTTKSIQGIMLFLAGLVIIIYLRLREHKAFYSYRYIYFASIFSLFCATVLGLLNRGPLAQFVFAPSVVFRADYWHAGFKITMNNPIFGIGLDSYGDYYRQYRGLLSTVRTIPERTANTAHNIFLDLSSGGGVFLLSSYLALLFISLKACLKTFRRLKTYDSAFAAIFSVLVGYQIQAFISIAQIGVSIWGWVFMGAAIGYERLTRGREANEEFKAGANAKHENKRDIKKSSSALLTPGSALASFAGFLLGVLVALPPVLTDAAFRSAYQKGDLVKMSEAVQLTGSSAYLVGLALENAAQNGNQVIGDPLNQILTEKYPRDMYGWRVKYAKPWSTPQERAEAVLKMRELDPFNPEIPKS